MKATDAAIAGLRAALSGMKRLWALPILFGITISGYGQNFEVAPLVGGLWGGALKMQQAEMENGLAELEDSVSFGASAGIRFDADDCESCNLIGFRWMRQNTHVNLPGAFLIGAPSHPSVSLDHFLVDFTREFPIEDTKGIVRPFLTASLGAARMATPVESSTRFEFGLGTGVNVNPSPRWGFRFHVEYLPMVRYAEVQRMVCANGCIIVLNGGVMNQFQVSAGPLFRF